MHTPFTSGLRVKLGMVAVGCVAFASHAAAGWYLTLEPGYTKVNLAPKEAQVRAEVGEGGLQNRELNDTSLGFSVGHRFGEWLAVEAGYVDLGDAEYAVTNAQSAGSLLVPGQQASGVYKSSSTAAFLGLDLRLPRWFDLTPFMKAGYLYWEQTARLTINDNNGARVTALDADGEAAYLGAGVSWQVSAVGAIDFTYRRMTIGADLDAEMVGLGLVLEY